MKIYVGFSHSKSPLGIGSHLIRLIEDTAYSHVYMRIGPFIVQSNHVGTHIIDKYTFMTKNVVVKEFILPTTSGRMKRIFDIIEPFLGKKYGIGQLFGILFSIIFGIHKNPFKTGYICSELIYLILKEIYDIEINKDKDLITPKDLYELLTQDPSWRQ